MTGPLALFIVTAIWGTTFVVVQDSLASWSPMLLLAGRFGLSTLIFVPIVARLFAKRAISAKTFRTGALLGTLMFLAYAFQTVGLAYTTSSRAAFINSTCTLMVPILGWLLFKKPIVRGTWIAIALGATGIGLLFGEALGDNARTGDLLSAASAATFAFYILLLSEQAEKNVMPLVAVQLATTTVLSLVSAFFMGERLVSTSVVGVTQLLYLGLAATALVVFLQAWGQSRTSANRAAFIYALEPLCAAAFAWAVHRQALAPLEWVGGACIIAASLCADRAWPERARVARSAS